MRILRSRSAQARLAGLLLVSAIACQEIRLYDPTSTVQVVVVFDPDPGRAPRSCNDLVYEYTATRTGDAAGAPAAGPEGDGSSSDVQVQKCSSRGETFTFPDKGNLKAGLWTFTLDVRADAVSQFGGTCSAVTTRAATRHVITFTQSRQGPTATCTFSF